MSDDGFQERGSLQFQEIQVRSQRSPKAQLLGIWVRRGEQQALEHWNTNGQRRQLRSASGILWSYTQLPGPWASGVSQWADIRPALNSPLGGSMEQHQAHLASGTSCELGSWVALASYFFGRMLSLSFSICKQKTMIPTSQGWWTLNVEPLEQYRRCWMDGGNPVPPWDSGKRPLLRAPALEDLIYHPDTPRHTHLHTDIHMNAHRCTCTPPSYACIHTYTYMHTQMLMHRDTHTHTELIKRPMCAFVSCWALSMEVVQSPTIRSQAMVKNSLTFLPCVFETKGNCIEVGQRL